jgi:hypothetical protein
MSIDPANLSSEKVKLPDPARVEIYFTSTPSPNSTPSLVPRGFRGTKGSPIREYSPPAAGQRQRDHILNDEEASTYLASCPEP